MIYYTEKKRYIHVKLHISHSKQGGVNILQSLLLV